MPWQQQDQYGGMAMPASRGAFGAATGQAQPATPRGLSAQETFAALTRAQWDEYLTQYVPMENLMINYATDPNAVNEAVASARRNVGMSFDAQQGSNQRRMRGFGLALDGDEQRAADRSTGLARSLADVSAANLVGDRVRERQQSVLGNPSPTVKGI